MFNPNQHFPSMEYFKQCLDGYLDSSIDEMKRRLQSAYKSWDEPRMPSQYSHLLSIEQARVVGILRKAVEDLAGVSYRKYLEKIAFKVGGGK